MTHVIIHKNLVVFPMREMPLLATFGFATLSATIPTVAFGQQQPPEGVSRRVSTCVYRIVFRSDGKRLDSESRSVIDAALAEARSRSPSEIVLSGDISSDENVSLRRARIQTVQRIIAESPRRSLATTVRSIDPTEALPSGQSVFIHVCADQGSVRPVFPEDREGHPQTVDVQIGDHRFHIPLRYLQPAFWFDTPFEVLYKSDFSVTVGWPSFEGQASSAMLECYRITSTRCNDSKVVIRLRYMASREPVANSPTYDFWTKATLRFVPAPESALHNVIVFQLSDGVDTIDGHCIVKGGSVLANSVEGYLSYIAIHGISECELQGLRLKGTNVTFDVSFSPKFIHELRDIGSSSIRLLKTF